MSNGAGERGSSSRVPKLFIGNEMVMYVMEWKKGLITLGVERLLGRTHHKPQEILV